MRPLVVIVFTVFFITSLSLYAQTADKKVHAWWNESYPGPPKGPNMLKSWKGFELTPMGNLFKEAMKAPKK